MTESNGVLLRGLPFEADQQDIKQFFNSIDIPHNNIEMIFTYNGKFSGLAYIQLRDAEEVKVALLMDRNHMGGRYIDVMTVTEEKVDQIRKAASGGLGCRDLHRMCASQPGRKSGGGAGPSSSNGRGGYRLGGRERSRSPQMRSMHTRFAYFRGFPEDVLYKGVRTFFENCVIGKGCVHLFRADNNKFRGDGYIEFASYEELQKGLRKDGTPFRNHRIEIEPCAEEEVIDMLPYMMDRTGPNARPMGSEEGYGGYRRRTEHGGYRHEDIGGRGRWKDSPGYRDHPRESGNKWGGYRRRDDRYSEYHSPRREHFEPYIDDRRRPEDFGRGGPDLRDGYHDQRSYRHSDHVEYMEQHGSSGTKERRTLRMEGVSPSTGVSDVVSFFKNYGIQFENVRIQCHDDGTPNGKAFVTFPSEHIASAAFHDMNHRQLKNGYIELLPVA